MDSESYKQKGQSYDFVNICDLLSSIMTIENETKKNELDFKICHKTISTLHPQIWNQLILFLTGQKITKVDSYGIYKQDYETLNFELITYIMNKPNSYYEFILNISNSHILLNAISPSILATHIANNIDRKNIYLPLIYSCDTKEYSHIALIVINIKDKKIYLLDPNGSPTYFDEVFGNDLTIPISYQIEMTLSQYFNELSNLGGSYEYVPVSSWNKTQISLNKSFKNDYVGSGHCMMFTLLFSNLLNMLDSDPYTIFKILKSYSDEELLFIIKEYSLGIYCMLNYLK